MTFTRSQNRQPGDDEAEKRGGADDRNEERLSHGSSAQFFNQRGSVHSKQFGCAILVSVGAFQRLPDKPVLKLGEQHA